MKTEPNITEWLAEAKRCENAEKIGMYLTHNGVVRATPKHVVREGAAVPESFPAEKADAQVVAVEFSYDAEGLAAAEAEALTWDGVYFVRTWLNEGRVPVGDSLMYVLIGADIRPHAIDALNRLVGHIKNDLVSEVEIYE
jgi:molybdopterin synthase catalytic subunit